MSLALLGENALLLLALATALWLASVRLRDASIVDPWWSILFLVVTANTVRRTGLTPGKTALLVVVALWSLRLFAHLLWRSRGKPEDPRYAAFRQRFGPERYWWFSFFQVFLLQSALAFAISAPLQWAASRPGPDPVSWHDALGLALFAVGFVFEAGSDAQLQRFRNDTSRRGAVLDTGFFALTRHPNYFGDAVLWWGFGAMAQGEPIALITLFGPALMTFLLVRVSGVSLLDEHLAARKPGYAEYMRRTPGFVPRWPRGSRRVADES
jgi:steroid 5-alpha reductase family enzyme